MPATVMDLFEGGELVLDGRVWTVGKLEPHLGRVVLHGVAGEVSETTIRALMHHRDCRPSSRTGKDVLAANRGRQPKTLQDLTSEQRRILHARLGHVLEAETGYRSGDPLQAAPGEPRADYDPVLVPSVTQRRKAKVRELAALRESDRELARTLGLHQISQRTLERMAANQRRWGIMGCADDRWLRACTGHYSVTDPVREAIYAVRAESLHRSRVSMATRTRMIHQYVAEKYGDGIQIPSSETLRTVWGEWFGPGGARQRYARSAAVVEAVATGGHVVIHRPGQVVALDTTPLPVLVRETVFSQPVEAHLSLALDCYTHSLVAFRLTLVSEKSVDVAMLLRDVMTPLPMRADWGADMAWPYPGIPGTLVADLAGYEVAGLPFFRVETVTTDHGPTYKNHHLIEVQRVIGANIVPSRVMRPTDKQACERAFGAIQSLLFQQLPGYRGVDVADRGTDPQADAALTLEAMENLIATWIVKIWQNRILGEYGPSWDPGGEHSPNTLFAAAMAQGGFSLELPRPELYYELLPTHHVKIHGLRGVKIRGLWYNGVSLDPYRDKVSTRGGRHQRSWVIRSDQRDARMVFFQDPDTHQWHELRWTGLPAQGQVPAFSDARVKELLREARGMGLKPKSDNELLPLLLNLIGGHIPVEQWPTQLTKRQRKDHARQDAQHTAARSDRPDTAQPVATPPDRELPASQRASARWAAQAQDIHAAVDTERQHRREHAVPQRPAAPARLGDRLRHTSLLSLIPDDEAEPPALREAR